MADDLRFVPGIVVHKPNRAMQGLRPFGAFAAVTLLSVALAGCPPPIVQYSSADAFARAIFRVAHEGDVAEWGTLLTAERRAMGKPYVQEHFGRWQHLVLEIEQGPFAGDLSIAKFRIENGALEFESDGAWVHFLRVEMEDGGWKINQD